MGSSKKLLGLTWGHAAFLGEPWRAAADTVADRPFPAVGIGPSMMAIEKPVAMAVGNVHIKAAILMAMARLCGNGSGKSQGAKPRD